MGDSGFQRRQKSQVQVVKCLTHRKKEGEMQKIPMSCNVLGVKSGVHIGN